MKMLFLSGCAALTLGACASLDKLNTQIATTDAKLRDKCAYLQSGVALARIGASFFPAAAVYVDRGEALFTEYCSGRPVTDVVSAMAAMERVIVAIRPIAAQVPK